MLTPHDIQDKKFAKAVFGGYDMTEVDDFLDQLGGDYEKLVKESAVLKSKLKALAEKVEEYRAVDEELRKTLVAAKRSTDEQIASAQREREHMLEQTRHESERVVAEAQAEAQRVVAEARARSEDMVIDARAKAESRLVQIKNDLLSEQDRYAKVREQILEYVNVAGQACRRQAELLQTIASAPKMDVVAPVRSVVSEPTPQPAPAAVPHIDDSRAEPQFERITERHGDAENAVPPTQSPGQVNLSGVTVNVTSLDLNAHDDEDDNEEAFKDIFK